MTTSPSDATATGVPFLGVGVGLRPKHYPRVLEALDPRAARHRLLRGDLRELHGAGRAATLACSSEVRARFPRRTPRRLAERRLRGSARSRLSRGARRARSPLRARLDLRPPVLDRRRRPQPPRSASAALHGRGAGPRRRARAARAGPPRAAHRARERVVYLAYRADAMPEWEFLVRSPSAPTAGSCST